LLNSREARIIFRSRRGVAICGASASAPTLLEEHLRENHTKQVRIVVVLYDPLRGRHRAPWMIWHSIKLALCPY
jgi:hypothetical protein